VYALGGRNWIFVYNLDKPRMSWAGHMSRIGERRGAYRVLW
jgi:hypothetical protein